MHVVVLCKKVVCGIGKPVVLQKFMKNVSLDLILNLI